MVKRKYNTEEERKAARRESERKRYYKNREKILEQKATYRANHKEEKAAYDVEYRANNREKIAAKQAEYRSTPFGRAACLVGAYQQQDSKYNRGDCTIDAQWIVDNIFTQSCHYCGETDFMKLGCDRIDNTKPHTPDNVVCSCWDCNLKKQKTPYDEFMRMIGKIA